MGQFWQNHTNSEPMWAQIMSIWTFSIVNIICLIALRGAADVLIDVHHVHAFMFSFPTTIFRTYARPFSARVIYSGNIQHYCRQFHTWRECIRGPNRAAMVPCLCTLCLISRSCNTNVTQTQSGT